MRVFIVGGTGLLGSAAAAELVVDPAAIRDELGVGEDGIDSAIGESVRLCLEAIRGRRLQGMMAE
jgi:hypothetical protein